MCGYCGAETVALGGIGMCSNCENMINLSRDTIESVDPALASSLGSIITAMASNDFDSVDKSYDALLAEKRSPQLLYASALARIKHSNYEISQIRYDRKGFMEENAVHRSNASKLMSAARRMLTKGAYMSKSTVSKGESSPAVAFSLFLSQLKLGNMRGARYALKLLGKTGDEYSLAYANMLFASSMRKYKEADKYAFKLTTPQSFSINAFFYMAFSMFKRHAFGDARTLLSGISGFIKSSNPELLLEAIDRMEWKHPQASRQNARMPKRRAANVPRSPSPPPTSKGK